MSNVLIAISYHRAAAIPSTFAHDVYFPSQKRVGSAHDRADVEVVLPVLNGDVKWVTPRVEVRDNGLACPVSVLVNDVTSVSHLEEFKVVSRIIGPPAWPRPYTGLGGVR